MPIYTDSFNDYLGFDMDSNIEIKALDHFKESLERYLLSEVSVRKCSSQDGSCSLVIGVYFNFTLFEMASCLKYQNAIQQENICDPNGGNSTVFFNALSKLYRENSIGLDIMELSIHLKNTSITIEKIYEQSIPDQLQNLLNTLEEHQANLCSKKFEVPYEIYIPVIEEAQSELEHTLQNNSMGQRCSSDYFGYWGLYYESEEDAVIYDLANKSIEKGDLFMLNH